MLLRFGSVLGITGRVGRRCVEPCDAHYLRSTEILTIPGHRDDPKIAEERDGMSKSRSFAEEDDGKPKNRESRKTDIDRDADVDKTETEMPSLFNFLNCNHIDLSHNVKGIRWRKHATLTVRRVRTKIRGPR